MITQGCDSYLNKRKWHLVKVIICHENPLQVLFTSDIHSTISIQYSDVILKQKIAHIYWWFILKISWSHDTSQLPALDKHPPVYLTKRKPREKIKKTKPHKRKSYLMTLPTLHSIATLSAGKSCICRLTRLCVLKRLFIKYTIAGCRLQSICN